MDSLQKRYKWKFSHPNLKIGDHVVLKGHTSPLVWSLGRVSKVFLGRDNRVRVVELTSNKGSFVRPISMVAPLPLDSDVLASSS